MGIRLRRDVPPARHDPAFDEPAQARRRRAPVPTARPRRGRSYRPPVTKPPVYRPPVTTAAGDRGPRSRTGSVTTPPTTKPSGRSRREPADHEAARPRQPGRARRPRRPLRCPVAAVGRDRCACGSTASTAFQTFVKGVEANAAARRGPGVGRARGVAPIDASATWARVRLRRGTRRRRPRPPAAGSAVQRHAGAVAPVRRVRSPVGPFVRAAVRALGRRPRLPGGPGADRAPSRHVRAAPDRRPRRLHRLRVTLAEARPEEYVPASDRLAVLSALRAIAAVAVLAERALRRTGSGDHLVALTVGLPRDRRRRRDRPPPGASRVVAGRVVRGVRRRRVPRLRRRRDRRHPEPRSRRSCSSSSPR